MALYDLSVLLFDLNVALEEAQKDGNKPSTEHMDRVESDIIEIQGRYGTVIGELRVKYLESEALDKISEKLSKIFEDVAKSGRDNEKLLLIATAVAPLSELVSLGKQLEEKEKEDEKQESNIIKRITALENWRKELDEGR